MKQRFTKIRNKSLKHLFLLCALMISTGTFAADRYWLGVNTDWSDTQNWAETSGGTGGFSVPGSGDDVFFDGNGNFDCDIPASSDVEVANMTLENDYSSNVSVEEPSGFDDPIQLRVTNFNLEAGSFLFAFVHNFRVDGNFTQSGGNFTAPSSSRFLGVLDISSGNFDPNDGTVELGVGGDITGDITFYDLEFIDGSGSAETFTIIDEVSISNILDFNGSEGVTINGIINFNGTSSQTLSIPSHVTLDDLIISNTSSSGVTLETNITNTNVTGDVTVLEGGVLVLTNEGNPFPTPSGSVDLQTGSTVEYGRSGVQDVAGVTYSKLKISGSNSKSVQSTVTVSDTLFLISGELTVGSNTLILNGGVDQTSGTLTSSAFGTVNYTQASNGQEVLPGSYGNLTFSDFDKVLPAEQINVSGTFDAGTSTGHTVSGNTINFNGADGQVIPSFTYYNLSSSNNSRTLSGTGIIEVNNNFSPNNGAYSVSSSTVLFNGVDQSIPSFDFNNLTIDNGGTKTILNPIKVAGELNIASGTLFIDDRELEINGTFVQNGTLQGDTTSTLEVRGSSSTPIELQDITVNNLVINRPGGVTMAGEVTIGGASAKLQIDAGSQLDAGDFRILGNGEVSISGRIITTNAEGLRRSGSDLSTITSGVSPFFLGGGSVVEYARTSGTQRVSTLTGYGNIEINGGGGIKELFGDITLGAEGASDLSLTISEGVTLNAKAHSIAFDTDTLESGSVTINGTLLTRNANGFSGGANTTIRQDVNPDITLGPNSTINYNRSGAQTITNEAYANLTLGGSGEKTPQDSITTTGDFTVSGSATLPVADYDITVGGDWNVPNGAFTAGTGLVTFNGGNQTISNAHTFNDITINASGNVTPNDAMDVEGILTLSSGTVVSNGNLGINFDDGAISGLGSGTVTGDVRGERTISSTRTHYLSPVFGGVIPSQWNDDTPVKHPATGLTRLHQYNSSMNDWEAINDLSTSLDPITGYSLWFPETTTLDISGSYDHSQTYSTGNLDNVDTTWYLFANPYPSTLDWEQLTKENFNAVYYWDAENSRYATHNGIGDVNGGTQYIPAMQAFFTNPTGTGGETASINFTNTSRDTSDIPAFFKEEQKSHLSLVFHDGDYSDETLIAIDGRASTDYDGTYDAKKLMNTDDRPNFFSVAEGDINLVINAINDISDDMEIPLRYIPTSDGNKSISYDVTGLFENYEEIVLIDHKENIYHDLLEDTVYTFEGSVDDNQDRFSVALKPSVITSSQHNDELNNVIISSPDHNMLRVELKNQPSTNPDVRLLTANGVEMLSTSLPEASGVHEIETGQLAPGIYIVKVMMGNELHHERVFIK